MAGDLSTSKNPLVESILRNNPITIQVLGICSSLAVTSQLKPALVMGIAVTVVVAGSNVVISLIRNLIPNRVRLIVEMVLIASLVILVDLVLKAYLPDVSKKLSVFVGLIITNCIVLGRLEAYALTHKPWESFLDGIGNGLGYAIILAIIGSIREILGKGSWLGIRVIPESIYASHGGWYANNGFFLIAPAAFIILGLIVWLQRTITGYEEK